MPGAANIEGQHSHESRLEQRVTARMGTMCKIIRNTTGQSQCEKKKKVYIWV